MNMTATRKQMAEAFVSFAGKTPSHPSVEIVYLGGGQSRYELHGNCIASFDDNASPRVLAFDWCNWYTPTTAAHMNEILRAAGSTQRVSYAQARDSQTRTFTMEC
jgi:hypothetical protein